MLEIYVANLGKYVEGELVGGWIELPVDKEEFQEFLKEKVGINERYEEIAIHDYACDIPELSIGEYDSIDDLNTLAEWLDTACEAEIIAFRAYLEDTSYYNYIDAMEFVENGDYTIYYDCVTMEDVARQYAEDTGLLSSIPENLQFYFDFEAFGRDMQIEGSFIEIDNHYVELYY